MVTNAGGINTGSCVAALKEACSKQGVDLNVAAVHGDNLMPKLDDLLDSEAVKEMSTSMPLPQLTHSMTAYYGAGPIVKALEMGADIVVTGRTADSALALAPLMHEFNWDPTDFDRLAAGSLAGHLIECGGQATGGLFTDFERVQGYENLGFPVVDVASSGDLVLTKPPNTGGLLDRNAVAEQMLYEVGDPANYILPDVICDFTDVVMSEVDEGIMVSGAKGKAPTDTFKVSATYLDGFKATGVAVVAGGRAAAKARKTAEAILARSRGILKAKGMADFSRTHISVIGAEDSFGANAAAQSQLPREAVVWMSVAHPDKRALDIWAREIASSGTGMAPGLCQLVGGRPKAIPCLKLFSFLYPKSDLPATIELGDRKEVYDKVLGSGQPAKGTESSGSGLDLPTGSHTYTLGDLAYARSGDKGNSCNIGVIARHPKYLPYIKKFVTADAVGAYFSHFFESSSPTGKVTCFDVPGIGAINFLLEDVLDGGGIASMRPDPLGKAFAQMLLDIEIKNVPSLEEMHK